MSQVDEPLWDRHRINAEIRRRGLTLTRIAIDAGLGDNACRSGVIGGNRKGARAIATRLGIPFRVLFPTMYLPPRPDDGEPIPNNRSHESAKRAARTDGDRRLA